MKNSRLLVFIAGINIASIIAKFLVSFINGGWMIPQGWGTGLIIDILTIYILATSNIRNKWVYVILGGLFFVAITCVLATLATFGVVHYGW